MMFLQFYSDIFKKNKIKPISGIKCKGDTFMKATSIVSKIGNKVNELQSKATPYIAAVSTGLAMGVTQNVGWAAGSSVASIISTVLCIICSVGGGINALTGGVAFAEAKSEGDGPALTKAKNQLAGGAALIAVGVAIKAIDISGLLGI